MFHFFPAQPAFNENSRQFYENANMYRLLILFLICEYYVVDVHEFNTRGLINKLFLPTQVTVSKLPPVLEYVLQRIQTINSNYVHEDLSRPPTWNRPIYTLPIITKPTEVVTEENVVHSMEHTENKPENLFEIIPKVEDNKSTTEKLWELINSTKGDKNESFVYITPRPFTNKPNEESDDDGK